MRKHCGLSCSTGVNDLPHGTLFLYINYIYCRWAFKYSNRTQKAAIDIMSGIANEALVKQNSRKYQNIERWLDPCIMASLVHSFPNKPAHKTSQPEQQAARPHKPPRAVVTRLQQRVQRPTTQGAQYELDFVTNDGASSQKPRQHHE